MVKQSIAIRRVYDEPTNGEGAQFLVDGTRPRGIGKEDLHLDRWLKDVAPTSDLRHWFGHDAARRTEFGRGYEAEPLISPRSFNRFAAPISRSSGRPAPGRQAGDCRKRSC